MRTPRKLALPSARINLLKNLMRLADGSLFAAARGHAFKSGSLSFRAARIVAAVLRMSRPVRAGERPPASSREDCQLRKASAGARIAPTKVSPGPPFVF